MLYRWYTYLPLGWKQLNLGYKTRKLMFYREIIAVVSQIFQKHKIPYMGRTWNFEVYTGGTYSAH
jgi:hypothetical protein